MIGQTISHYKILEKLGEGGMGVVYKAEDTKLRRTVALKFLPPELTRVPDAKKRFVQEAQAASSLDHSNICTIYEIDETSDGQLFIAMSCYEGESLRERLERGAPDIGDAVDIALQIASGLAKAHEKGIVHRDIKPGNILITLDGQVKIVDFGLAKLAGQTRITKSRTTVGTVAYMSPEQAKGEEVDNRSDIWSLGISLYEMVAGQLPFAGDHEQAMLYSIMNEKPRPLTGLRTGVPVELEQIIGRCLAKDPNQRYQEVGALLTELHSLYRRLQPSQAEPIVSAVTFKSVLRFAKRPKVAAVGSVVLILLGMLIIRTVYQSSKVRWAREVAVPEVARLVEQDNYSAAFALAMDAEHYISSDRTLIGLWPRMSQLVSITTTPAGANVNFRGYPHDGGEWEHLGQSPVDSRRFPLGPFWLRIEKEGFETIESLFIGRSAYVSPEVVKGFSFSLDEEGTIPPGMVRIPQSQGYIRFGGFTPESLPVSAYLIDKREVTNRQFKEFVDDDGYRIPEYWEHEIIKEGRVLVWEEAMAEFLDRTGRPGPSSWQGGTYPEGQDDYPVSGVSWYEAAAYARYVGKSLPTIYHWFGATDTYYGTYIIPFSNFRNQGVAAAGSGPVGLHGTYDMAGNVKEWCWNASGSLRYILGGSWDEPTYMFGSVDAQAPCNRSPTYGFRCARYQDVDEQSLAALSRPIEKPALDYRWEEPVSEEIFRVYKSHYSYDPTPLDAVVESVDEESPYWLREKITFNAAYGEERVIAFLFVPRNVDPPYQTVIYFPGSTALGSRSSEKLRMANVDFVIMSGRAVMYPVYKGTYERNDRLVGRLPDATTRAYAEYVVRWINDLRRSIDYLETRDDIDMEKLAFYGYSWGGHMGPIALAIEERFKLGILVAGGIPNGQRRPEVKESVFAPRVTVPVLMVNGANDFIFRVDTNQKRMFELLGAPEEHKKHIIYDSGHSVLARSNMRNQAIREILNWLDHYLGRVPPQNPIRP